MPRSNIKKTTHQFVSDAQKVHGERYGYELCSYSGAHRKLTVVCRIHGAFSISANSHLQGSGCPNCNGGRILASRTFLARARDIHGSRYKYGDYRGLKNEIEITCEHGTQRVTAHSHLKGTGCPKCRDADKLKAFIREARKVHGRRYDYSECSFDHCDRKVKIICRKHGAFLQSPHNHLDNHGCPACSKRS